MLEQDRPFKIIRQAVASDEKTILEIAESAFIPYLERMDRKPFPMLDDYALHIAAGHAFVLEDMNGPQAFVVLLPGTGRTLLLETIAVRPQCQKAGYGKALMAWAEGYGRDNSCDCITLYTNEIMWENIVWYGRLGYEEYDRRVENGYRRIYFRKRLSP